MTTSPPTAPWADGFKPPLVIAHRGASTLAHENSKEAFELARRHGAAAVEADVRRTTDGALVCLHDPDLLRLAGDPRLVRDLRLDEILALVPEALTLDEVIAASAPLGLLLDVKLAEQGDVDPMLAIIRLSDATRILIGLRDLALARHTRSVLPEADILAFAPPEEMDRWSSEIHARWFRLWEADASSGAIERAKQLGMRVAVMVGESRDGRPPFEGRRGGVVDRNRFRSLAARGADAVLLDDPRIGTGSWMDRSLSPKSAAVRMKVP
ncbi:MAG: cobalamin biosynthesis protein [Hyphomicrobiales bacterium]|nr:cobalamin biosynthesis protein [Hyphomicrobiales bacterium]